MAAKIKTHYSCQSCGAQSHQWLGKCSACGEWNTLVEEREGGDSSEAPKGSFLSRLDSISAGGGRGYVAFNGESSSESGEGATQVSRWHTGYSELDRVLGGGLVRDSFVLLGGDPGIGKSTLLLQMASGLLQNNSGLKVLYISGEESVAQLQDRALRLRAKGSGKLFFEAETVLEKALGSFKELRPDVLIIDSLQTFASNQLESAPGTVSQVREVAARLMHLAKSSGVAVLIIGHVTKDGSIAGPKVVEHMVDTVLYFEAESQQSFRILRTVKNRFGNSRELGVFEMFGEGLREVTNPSALFLEDRRKSVPGTAVSACLEGTRPLLVEFQALVSRSSLAMPRRTSVGFDSNRISLLAAILEKHLKLPLFQEDLFFNVAGGLRIQEPACDLGAAVAIYSSEKEIAVPSDWAWMGELGLTGELRTVTFPEVRVQEAMKLGFTTAVVPTRVLKLLRERGYKNEGGIKLIGIQTIQELKDILRG